MIAIQKCRACNSKELTDVIKLGDFYLSEFARKKGSIKYPLELTLCQDCGLLQLKHTTPRRLLYNDDYGYRSGINKTMRTELANIVKEALKRSRKPRKTDIIVDIGASDATLLRNYSEEIVKVGFDPVSKFSKYFNHKNLLFINNYFSYELFDKKFSGKKAKIVTTISTFYDLENPNKFISDVKKILDEQGIFVIQQNYLLGMLRQNAFDNIVHEHLEYYSLTSLESLLNRHGLVVFDVYESDINGGSFRTYIKHFDASPPATERVKIMREKEKKAKIDNLSTYKKFAQNVDLVSKKLKDFIKEEVKKGKTVYLYGASTRGNTLLQVAGLDNRLIKKAADRNPEKWGKKIASVGIPIISEKEARSDKPDYMLVLPWFFRNEFIKREKEYLQKGGKFIFPLPKLEIIAG